MNDQEREIKKYKEQGRGTKKKGQIAIEPDKYVIDQSKMIGSPDMLSHAELRNFTINAMARKFGTIGILSLIIGPLGTVLSLGAVWMVYSKYMLGAYINEVLDKFYRPLVYINTGVFFGIVGIAWLVYHFVYSDKKRLIIRADDKITEAGMEPIEIPRQDIDRNRLIDAFYHLRTPYKLSYVLIVAALAVLITGTMIMFQAGAKQKVITDDLRAEVSERLEASLSDFDHTSKDEIMSFVDRHTFKINKRLSMIIDIDENGKVLDSSYLVRYKAKYTVAQLEELKSEGVRKEFEDVHKTTEAYKDLFVYPTVTKVPVKFSDYMLNYIDNIREASDWKGEQECKVDNDEYIMHCAVAYDEGESKESLDDDKMTVSYEIQLKNFKRTQW